MKGLVKCIGIIDNNGEVHKVEFSSGVNIITGRSSTGKSAIIEIFDYCFGSSEYTVPSGVITEYAALYFLVLQIREATFVIGRKPADKNVFIKEDSQFSIENDLNIEYFEESRFLRLDDFKLYLGHCFGITISDTDENLEDRAFRKNNAKKPRPSVRNFTSFMLQHQNLVANKHSLFYRFDQREKQEQTIEQFKIFAGFVSQEYFTKSQELNELRTQLKRLQLKDALEKNETQRKSDEIIDLAREYAAVTGIILLDELNTTTTINPIDLYDKIASIEVVTDYDSAEYLIQLKKLESQKNKFLAEKRELEIRLAEIDSSVEYANSYKNSIENIYRLQKITVSVSECPFCNNQSEPISLEANKLRKAIHWLNTELARSPYTLESFVVEQKKVRTDIKSKDLEIKNIINQIQTIRKITDSLNKNKSLEEQGLKIKLKIEAILEMIIATKVSNTQNEIGRINGEIIEMEEYISSNFNPEQKLIEAERFINENMNLLGKELDFEKSYTPINLHFSLHNFDLYHRTPKGGNIYLRSMGSGANWLYCHLSLFLSLNRYFCKLGNDCLIPPILFLDQPSQVYFPVSIKDNEEIFDAKLLKDKEGKIDDVNDLHLVESFFDQVVAYCDKTKELYGIEPQIIITDHADKLNLTNADFESLVNGRRWRSHNDGFIKVKESTDDMSSEHILNKD